MSAEQKIKISNTMRKIHKENPQIFEKFIRSGKKKRKSPLTIKICRVCSKQFSTKYNITCSKECLFKDRGIRASNLIRIGNWGKHGWCRGIWCESTYELAFVVWTKDHNMDIQRCKLRIPYFYKDREHYYTPDFQIGSQIYEIKGYINDKVSSKLEAAKAQQIAIIVIGNNEISKYIEYVNHTYRVNVQKEYKLFYEGKI